ncbi:9298_t:CDS:1 [Dentiscutata erythropus]|uniref:9298_t:CDS:1 n=1 Tax=Dentiscutata erythropus TaxID=1348616 RepID=A0A9N9GMH6_9GLOM|nr:9298_t:CDS:1 [Dentiscutata erythropus]
MTENNNIELVLKQQSVIDSCSECPIITYEIAKKLGFEKDKSLPNITDKMVSDIVKQVSGKKIWISLHRLLEIVKPEIRQEIINLIANSDISRRNRTPCKAKRKKLIFNDTASETTSTSESGSSSESFSDEDFTVDVAKAKKRD